MSKELIKIGLLGAGTVGSGVLKVLEKNEKDILKKVGVPLQIKKILVRNVDKYQQEYGDKYSFTTDVKEILEDPEIDIVVELLGRVHPAQEYIKEALEKGKQVITANKDVIAEYGQELFELAQAKKCDLLFEASVCGGIPIIGPMKNTMAGNRLKKIMGIVNGTTNYMLSKMSNEHMEYDAVLKQAQEMGYAESDPTADVGGLDAARKIAILATLAFNVPVALEDVAVEGIENLEQCDIKYASDMGYAVKLLGISKYTDEYGVSAKVTPTMLPLEHPLASVNGAFNALYVKGDAIGEAMFLGLGAGSLPTASSVIGDIMECARHILGGSTGMTTIPIYREKKLCPAKYQQYPCYIRLQVADQSGALAAIAAAFAAQNVSLRNVIQNDATGHDAEIVVITHSVSEANLNMAVQLLKVLPVVKKVCCIVRVEDKSLA